MQYFVSTNSLLAAQKLKDFIKNLEKTTFQMVPYFEGNLSPNPDLKDLPIHILSLLEFLPNEKKLELYEILVSMVQIELENQKQLIAETQEEDLLLANLDLTHYQNNLNLEDNE